MQSISCLRLLALVPVLIVILCLVLEVTLNRHRVYDLERQDKGEVEGRYTYAEFVDMMHILAESNVADPHGFNATLDIFKKYYPSKSGDIDSIVEIGFGLGHFAVMLANEYENATIVGIDAHQFSVDSANEYLSQLAHTSSRPPNVRFELRPESKLAEMRKSFDIVTTTMVNHHIFPDEVFVEFLKQIAVVGKKAFIFNDFHRTTGCILMNDLQFLIIRHIGLDTVAGFVDTVVVPIVANIPILRRPLSGIIDSATRYKDIMSNSRPGIDLVVDGGMLSMRRAFSLAEYKKVFAQAGYSAQALNCHRMDEMWFVPGDTCRVICVADLIWNK
jgi:hypothetical protein